MVASAKTGHSELVNQIAAKLICAADWAIKKPDCSAMSLTCLAAPQKSDARSTQPAVALLELLV